MRHHVPGAGRHFGAEDVVLLDEEIRAGDVLPVNRTMKKYKIYVTNNLNFFTSRFLNFRYIFAIQNPSPGGQVSSIFTLLTQKRVFRVAESSAARTSSSVLSLDSAPAPSVN